MSKKDPNPDSQFDSEFDSQSEPQFDGLEEDLAQLAVPVTPPPALKESIMAQLDSVPQEPGREVPQPSATIHNLGDRRQGEGGTHNYRITREHNRVRRWGTFASIAAAFVLLAGVGFEVFSVVSPGNDAPESQSVVADGTEKMYEIMAADDVRSASLTAQGAELAVVVSSGMESGGAMVNGAPQLEEGMGAQVWSIDAQGNARSAGVIGQEPHDDVWMPLPGDTMAVKVTVEPMAGAAEPKGKTLAQVTL